MLMSAFLNCNQNTQTGGYTKYDRDYAYKIAGYTNTKYGNIAINRYGEYIIEDWNIYYSVLKDSIYTSNYTLLKKLSKGMPIVDYYREEDTGGAGSVTTKKNYMSEEDLERIEKEDIHITKFILDKITMDEYKEIIDGELFYDVRTNYSENPPEVTYDAEIISTDNSHRMIFYNLKNGQGWKWIDLCPPPVD
jgi:hypothetical protein